MRVVELVHPEDYVKFSAGRARIASDGEAVFRYRARKSDGSYRWVESHAKPYLNADGEREGVLAIIRVVDAQVRAERERERLARYDELTGVLVRREVLERLKITVLDAAQAGERVAIVFCDVDQLAAINESGGIECGDVVLRAVADRIRACVRRSDLVGRIGEDEFLVALADVQKESYALRVAEKIRTMVAAPVEIGDGIYVPTLSIVVALVGPNEDADMAITRVEEASRRARGAGRDRVSLA